MASTAAGLSWNCSSSLIQSSHKLGNRVSERSSVMVVVAQKKVKKIRKIILKEDVTNVGEKGEVLDVRAGYFRNYLLPMGKAQIVTPLLLKRGKGFCSVDDLRTGNGVFPPPGLVLPAHSRTALMLPGRVGQKNTPMPKLVIDKGNYQRSAEYKREMRMEEERIEAEKQRVMKYCCGFMGYIGLTTFPSSMRNCIPFLGATLADSSKFKPVFTLVKEEAQQLAVIFETVGAFKVKRKEWERKANLWHRHASLCRTYASIECDVYPVFILLVASQDVDKRIVSLPEIRETGEYIALLKLHPDVTARVHHLLVNKCSTTSELTDGGCSIILRGEAVKSIRKLEECLPPDIKSGRC
ncbi:ribosomal protein L9 [Actinidia rufa]|uniref:Large ribosomal subunit protein bL9c n=1 Tax=Actinidia rufa TaxID=165716 RepID=A0A7J0H461_9ERIC|nr:ribosomal protein L9 [Actinidia rufa]